MIGRGLFLLTILSSCGKKKNRQLNLDEVERYEDTDGWLKEICIKYCDCRGSAPRTATSASLIAMNSPAPLAQLFSLLKQPEACSNTASEERKAHTHTHAHKGAVGIMKSM